MPDPRGKRGSSLIEHLTTQAGTTYVSTGLSLDKYFYSADLLLLQADQYRASGNQEQLYVMLMRYASLIIERVAKHKDLRAKDNPKYLRHQQLLLSKYLPELEKLKALISDSDPVACSANRPSDAIPISVSNLPEIKWYSSTLPSRPPPASALPDYSSHPVKVSQNALDFLSSDPISLPASAVPSLAPLSDGPGVEPAPAPSTSTSYSSFSNAIVSQQALSRHSLYSRPGAVPSTSLALAAPASAQAVRPAPRYPVDLLADLNPPLLGDPSMPAMIEPMVVQPDSQALAALAIAPPLQHPSPGIALGPQEVQVLDMNAHGADSSGTCASPAMPVGGVKPYTKKASLRDVQIAVSLLEDFMRLAQANTRRGIESCGILAGVLSANDSSFTITTLIVPKQKGSSDQVEMLSEEEIFDVQMSRELYPLGWIHTHPTQTCFLSSIDIHTQCAYQTMLDEAVAIVMAPTDSRKRCGIFRLSTPGGMDLIQKCTSRGFHMHPVTSTGQEIYEFSGHTFLNPRLQHDVVDLR